MIWLAAIIAVIATLLRQFSFYLESWQRGKKICLGHELSKKWADIGNYAATIIPWVARFLAATTIVLLIAELADRYL